jgi:DNA-binding NarL/FixJ family response regulator
MSEIRILIVEDEPLIATDIAMHLDNMDFQVSGIAYDSDDALRQLQHNTPDAVLLDINLNATLDGIEIAHLIKEKYQLPVVFLTSFSDRITLDRAKKTDPAGYIVKPFDERNLLATLEISLYNFAQRQNYTLPQLSIDKLNRHLPTPLTDREFDMLRLLYEGRTNHQIADEACVSVNTVKTHINNIYLKLEATSRSTALRRLRSLLALA